MSSAVGLVPSNQGVSTGTPVTTTPPSAAGSSFRIDNLASRTDESSTPTLTNQTNLDVVSHTSGKEVQMRRLPLSHQQHHGSSSISTNNSHSRDQEVIHTNVCGSTNEERAIISSKNKEEVNHHHHRDVDKGDEGDEEQDEERQHGQDNQDRQNANLEGRDVDEDAEDEDDDDDDDEEDDDDDMYLIPPPNLADDDDDDDSLPPFKESHSNIDDEDTTMSEASNQVTTSNHRDGPEPEPEPRENSFQGLNGPEEEEEDEEEEEEYEEEGDEVVRTEGTIQNLSSFNRNSLKSRSGNKPSCAERNKRKNFRPRNIVNNEKESIEARTDSPLNLTSERSSDRKSLLPRKLDQEGQHPPTSSPVQSLFPSSFHSNHHPAPSSSGSPIDLSSSLLAEDENGTTTPRPSLSLVSKEVLFGYGRGGSSSSRRHSEDSKPPSELHSTIKEEKLPTQPNKEEMEAGREELQEDGDDIKPRFPFGLGPFFAPGLAAAAAAAGRPLDGSVASDTMKEAFQEVLKLYGVPVEIAEKIASNAQAAQESLAPQDDGSLLSRSLNQRPSVKGPFTSSASDSLRQTNSPAVVTSSSVPAGMLSAALLGNMSPLSPANLSSCQGQGHPPTPPRTPKTPGGTPTHQSTPDLSALLSGGGQQQQQQQQQLRFPAPDMKMSNHGFKTGGGHGLPPSFLSLASFQDQVLGKSNNANNLLASQLNKPNMMMPGMNMMGPGLPGPLPPHLRGNSGGIPPHILAAQRVGMLPGVTKSPTDYTRYFKRFGSSLECGSLYCKDMNYREHFHCTVPMCKDKVFAKKEEMIRHSKWHQKMEEAFKYGFRRVTPMDDCSDQFPGCQHNKKQTHYHCIHTDSCDKVYISTSDVQMHFNYHRKDNAIQREGFLRFRGVEDCATSYCPFRTQKTTHFHCNRSGCNFTFKNKADMEKHKNYHMKDEQLNKDGFKKFMKQEPCGFSGCRFSGTVNHIHCIRSNCDYVLHSSGQLYSHKRKHERKDNEMAYQKYKIAQSLITGDASSLSTNGNNGDLTTAERPPSNDNGSLNSDTSSTPPLVKPSDLGPPPNKPLNPFIALNNANTSGSPMPFGIQPMMMSGPQGMFGQQQPLLMSDMIRDRIPDDIWRNYMLHFDSGEGCGFQGCELEEMEHFHCKDDGCETVFRKHDGVQEHGRNHFLQDQITDIFFMKVDPEEPEVSECPELCPHKKSEQLHYHCKWENCSEIVFGGDSPFKRLDHYKLHEYTKKWNMAGKEPVSMTMTTSIDTMFKRKRGRPPKNRVVEVWNEHLPQTGLPGSGSSFNDFTSSPQAVFTSFKLPKPGLSVTAGATLGSTGGLGGNPSPLDVSNFHFGMSGLLTNSKSAASIMSAPLGGLPAMAGQIAAAAQNKSQDDEMAEKDKRNSPSPRARATTSSPHPIDANRKSPGAKGVVAKSSSSDNEQSSNEGTPPKHQGLIKSRGTYYPLTAFPTNMPQGPVMRREDEASPIKNEGSSSDESSPTVSVKSKLGLNFVVSYARQGDTENALAKLLQASQDMVSTSNLGDGAVGAAAGGNNNSGSGGNGGGGGNSSGVDGVNASIASRVSLSSHHVFGPEPEKDSCGRPFCKLKRRAHYHCNICNQGFTEIDKLEAHLKRHVSNPNEFANASLGLANMLRECSKDPGSNPTSADSPRSHTPNSPPPSHLSGTSSSEGPVSLVMNRSSTPPSDALRTKSSPSPKRSPGLPSTESSLPTSPVSPFLGGFPSPFANLLRPPFNVPCSMASGFNAITSQPGLLIPPGMPHFFPPGMMIPGLPNLFQRAPGLPSPTFDPTKHPLTRMPDSSALKRSSPLTRMLEGLDDSDPAKKMRLSPSMRMMKDEPVPEGYMRFRFNEDCGFTSCNYREHQTHFHCMRKDCNYRFCDKTRFVQHTARHERLDTLCGSEFEGFRGVTCGRDDCEYNIINNRTVTLPGEAQKSSSHFHCLKCDYHCTDTNKVVAHRRQHQKLDSIMAAGFEKYTPTQFCPITGCTHNGKQTHYHCSKCQYAVLGLSQMEAHKYRHMNE